MHNFWWYLFCLISLGVLLTQIKALREIKIREQQSKSVKIISIIVGLLFLSIGWSISHFFIQYILFLFISLLFIFNPFTTGLASDGIYYKQNTRGFSGLVSRFKNYNQFDRTQIKSHKNKFIISFKKNSFQQQLYFSMEDKEQISNVVKDVF